MAFEGRILIIGFASGQIPKIPANLLLLKVASAVGVFWGSTMMRHPESFMESVNACTKALAEGTIQPHFSSSFPLAQVGFNFHGLRYNDSMLILNLRLV